MIVRSLAAASPLGGIPVINAMVTDEHWIIISNFALVGVTALSVIVTLIISVTSVREANKTTRTVFRLISKIMPVKAKQANLPRAKHRRL